MALETKSPVETKVPVPADAPTSSNPFGSPSAAATTAPPGDVAGDVAGIPADPDPLRPISIRVGGREFQTSRATLTRFPASHLAVAFLRHERSGSAEPLFVDGDGDRFRDILNYLRTGDLRSLVAVTHNPRTLRADARYYGLDAVAAEVEARCDRCRHCGLSAMDAPAKCAACRPKILHVVEGSYIVAFRKYVAGPSKVTLMRLFLDDDAEDGAAIVAGLRKYPQGVSRPPEADMPDLMACARITHHILTSDGDLKLLPFGVIVRKTSSHPNTPLSENEILGCVRCGFPGCTLDRPTCHGKHSWVGALRPDAVPATPPAIAIAKPEAKSGPARLHLVSGRPVTLNVGGKLVRTQLETLLRFPESRLALVVARHVALELKEPDGHREPLFVDGDAERFGSVLDYLRTLDARAAMEWSSRHTGLRGEAAAHGLDEMVAALDNHGSQCLECGESRAVSSGPCRLSRPAAPHYQVGSVVLTLHADSRIAMVEMESNVGGEKDDAGRILAFIRRYPSGTRRADVGNDMQELTEVGRMTLLAILAGAELPTGVED